MLKMRATIIVLLFATALFSQNNSQDSIFLLNGRIFSAKVLDTLNTSILVYNEKNPDEKLQFESDQLYLIKFENGFIRYYYSQDSIINNWLTREEMGLYMQGERDARKGFKAKGAIIGSATAGIIGGMTGSFWGPIAPYGFMALSGLPRVKIKKSTVSDTTFLKSNAYLLGYERVARQRLKTRSLIGGTAGLIVGYVLYAFTNQYYPESINIGFNR